VHGLENPAPITVFKVRAPAESSPIQRARIADKPERTRLEKITTLLQAVSAVLVPLLIAAGSLLIQQSIAKQTTAKDYVSLAIDILKLIPRSKVLQEILYGIGQ
jgi:hypothetical protein